jgi:hypothetical protein
MTKVVCFAIVLAVLILGASTGSVPQGASGIAYGMEQAALGLRAALWPDTVTLPAPNVHAMTKHGPASVEVLKCLEQHGPASYWLNTQTGRVLLPCQMPDGRYGVYIVERIGKAWENVTSFVTRYTTKGSVHGYLSNGAMQFNSIDELIYYLETIL